MNARQLFNDAFRAQLDRLPTNGEMASAYHMYKEIRGLHGTLPHSTGGGIVGCIFNTRPPDDFLEQVTGEVKPR